MTAAGGTVAGGTIVEMLARAAKLAHQGGVLIAGGEQFRLITWRDIAAQACRAADAIAERGIAGGDRVAIAAGNSLDWIVADLAIQMLGGVVVPLHASLTGQQLAWQLQQSGSRLLIVGGDEVAGK